MPAALLLLDKLKQQLRYPLGLFLLHPMPGAVNQMAAEHAGAGALLHARPENS